MALYRFRSAIPGNKRDDYYEWNRENEMKLTIIILSILLYISFGELTYQWTKDRLIKKYWKKAHYADLFLWPIAWILGIIRLIFQMRADKIAKDIEDMLR